MHPQRGKRAQVLCLREGRGQEFDQKVVARLSPAPDLQMVERRHRSEGEIAEHLLERLGNRVLERNRQPLEARDIDIACLSRRIEGEPHAQLAFVETKSLRPDDGAAETKDTGHRHGAKQATGSRLDTEKAFRAKNTDQSRSMLAPFFALLAPACNAGKPVSQLRAVFADICLLHVRADAIAIVPIDPSIAFGPRRRST